MYDNRHALTFFLLVNSEKILLYWQSYRKVKEISKLCIIMENRFDTYGGIVNRGRRTLQPGYTMKILILSCKGEGILGIQPVRKTLDEEWIILMEEARELGLTLEEVKEFIRNSQ